MAVCLVGGGHVLDAVHQLGHLGELGDALIDVEREFGSADLTGLGGDDDDTVTAAHTVDGRCGSVLEDGDGLDVGGVELAPAALDAVHEHERTFIAVGQSRETAHPDVGIVLSGQT